MQSSRGVLASPISSFAAPFKEAWPQWTLILFAVASLAFATGRFFGAAPLFGSTASLATAMAAGSMAIALSLLLRDTALRRAEAFAKARADQTQMSIVECRRARAAEHETRALQEAIAAMDGVIGVVGRELNTPLTRLRGVAEILAHPQGCQPERAAALHKVVQAETLRMTAMVSNMLEAARLSHGVATWNWRPFNIRGVCEIALSIVRPLVDESLVALGCVVPSDLFMNGDADAIGRLLVNLLSNAAKHTTNGFINIVLSQQADHVGRWIDVEVCDSGEGIEPRVSGQLEETAVLRGGVVRAEHIKGSGLGLTICKALVAAHGGTLGIRSNPGHGTRFSVRLRADLLQPVPLSDHAGDGARAA